MYIPDPGLFGLLGLYLFIVIFFSAVCLIFYSALKYFHDKTSLYWDDNYLESEQSERFCYDLRNKIYEMEEDCDDVNVSISDWLEIIPVCKYADEWYLKTHPGSKIYSIENLAKSKMKMA